MKRLAKTLFSRLFVVALAIILQVAAFMFIVYYLNMRFVWAQFIMGVVAVLAVLGLINRDMLVECMIPWLILILIVPLFGVIVYMLFSENKLSFRQRKTYRDVFMETARVIRPDRDGMRARYRRMGRYAGQARYVFKTTRSLTYENTKVDYYPMGELFWKSLLDDLQSANRFIFLEYFIVERGVMWSEIEKILVDKASNGVEVRFMYDDIGSVSKVKSRFARELREKGVNCVRYNPFRPIISEIHNNRDHRKITVVDGRVGYVGGANFADEYINVKQPFGVWKDTAVRLEGEAVEALTVMFLQNFDSQTSKVDDFSKYVVSKKTKAVADNVGQNVGVGGSRKGNDISSDALVDAEDDVEETTVCNCDDDGLGIVMPYGDGPKPAYNDYVGENVYLNMISQAQNYIWITTPYLVIDSKMRTALCLAARRGVDVRIVMPGIPDKKYVFRISRSNYRKLQDCGVKIFEYRKGFVHAKQFICDDEVATVGTVNLDYRSFIHHFECGVWMYKTPCIADMKADFIKMFDESENMFSFYQGVLTNLYCKVLTAFTPLL